MSKPSHLTKETHAAEDVHVLKHTISINMHFFFICSKHSSLMYIFIFIHLRMADCQRVRVCAGEDTERKFPPGYQPVSMC